MSSVILKVIDIAISGLRVLGTVGRVSMIDNIIFLENPFGWSGYRTPYIVYNVKEDREYGNY